MHFVPLSTYLDVDLLYDNNIFSNILDCVAMLGSLSLSLVEGRSDAETATLIIKFGVCVCFLPIHSGRQVRWTYQPGSHRRKVTQDFSSTFFLRCVL